MTSQMMMTCYNMLGEVDNEDDPRTFDIQESEGSQDIIAPKVSGNRFTQPLKLKKVNIGTTEDPK